MSARRSGQRPTTVVFLGAGASRADRAPLQSELFREYFLYYNSQPNGRIHHTWVQCAPEVKTNLGCVFAGDGLPPEGGVPAGGDVT